MYHTISLKKYAVQYLSKYDSTKKNLERVLKNKIRRMNDIKKKEKFILYQSIFKIIEELESKQIINDKRYADTKILYFSFQGKSKNFIKNYLFQKGIEKNIINSTLNNFELNNPDWEFESAKIFVRKKISDFNEKSVNSGKAICMKQSWNQECQNSDLIIDRLSDIMSLV